MAKQKKKSFITLLALAIILILFPSFVSKEYLYKLKALQFYSEIQLAIQERGDQYILSTGIPTDKGGFYNKYEGPLPDYIWINGDSKIIKDTMIYNLTEEYNYITLIWDSPLNSTESMFIGVKNITKIVISHFDSTYLKNINGMFYSIALLTSIDLSNLNTSLVTDFGYLFFKCYSLISLDLSNFNISHAQNLKYMFKNCTSLLFLNLKSFTEESLIDIEEMFYAIRNDLTYCINATKASNIISEIQSNSKSSKNNCSDTCFLNSAIFLNDEKKCISSYEKNISFQYEYNIGCDQTCPKRTSIILYNNYSYEDLNFQKYYYYNQVDYLKKTPEGYYLNDSYIITTDKCNYYYYSDRCFSECIIYNGNNILICKDLFKQNSIKYLIYNVMESLYIYCYKDNGNVYYPFYNQSTLNNDTLRECYIEFEGYLVSFDKAFKPCFNTCKTCLEEGNETNNNCLECKDNFRFLNDSQNDANNNCYEECDENYYFDSLNKYHCTIDCPDGYKLIKEKKKCIDDCSKDDEYFFEFNNLCLKTSPSTIVNDIANITGTTDITDIANITGTTDITDIANITGTTDITDITGTTDITSTTDITITTTDIIVTTTDTTVTTADTTITTTTHTNTDVIIVTTTDTIDTTDLSIIKTNEEGECGMDFPYKLQINGKCVRKCKAKDIFIGICIIYTNNSTIKDEMINNTRNELSEHAFDELLENVINGKKKDLITVQRTTIFTLTTTDNQKNNQQKNESTIDLGVCETKLKSHYNISTNDPLLIFKIDLFEKGSDNPTIEYEIYNSKTKEKIELIYCQDTKIKINIPVKIDTTNEFKYNPVSDYYKDICFPYTTEDGTDINLKDRKNEFFDKNLSICESNCDYERYNSEMEKAICECEVKIKIPLISTIVINKDLLKSKFLDVKSYINLTVMKCYHILFTSNGLLLNIGSYIFLAIIFLNIILLIEFIYKGFKILCHKIYEIYKSSKSYKNKELMNNNNIIKTTGNIKKGESKKGKKKEKKNNSHIKEPPKKNNNKNMNRNKKNDDNKALKLKLSTSEVKLNLMTSRKNINNKGSNQNEISLLNSNKTKKNENKKVINNFIYYNDYEINILSYTEALKADKRTYSHYYFSLLRMKYSVIFIFFSSNDYNSKSIKICLFLFSFSLYFTINTLFFSDSTMHKIYVDKGSFDFIYQIPQILYSSLISGVINFIITYLSLSEKSIVNFKKDRLITEKKVANLINCLKVKFSLFFVFELSLLLFFWYYLSCFCAVYKNTQAHLIKDTLISFGMSLIYPLFFYLLPGIFRIISLRAKTANRECLYKISKILQLI